MNSYTEEVKQALMEAGDRGLLLREIVEKFVDCSETSVSTCLKNWMDSGHVTRSGVRRSYRYFYTGKEFSKSTRKGQRCKPTDSYQRIYEAISGLYGAWFSSGSLAKQLQIEQSVICNCLVSLLKGAVLERRGHIRFEYRQIAPIPSFRFPRGEIPEIFFNILLRYKRPLNVENATRVVEKIRSLAGKNGHPHLKYYEAVRRVAERWALDGHLIVTHEDGVAHYQLVDGITERPLSLAK